MFDSFAFSEVLVICVVALVVLGPTRLPGVVRKLGRWIGKARAMARDFRQQLENEVTLEELNRMTEKQSRREPPPAGDAAAGSGAGTPDAPEAPDTSVASGASPADGAPQPGDDTYSHAHADGESPPAWDPEADAAAATPAANPAAAASDAAADAPADAAADAPQQAEVRPDPAPAADAPLEPDPAAPTGGDKANA